MVSIVPTEVTLDEGKSTGFVCIATGLGASDFKYQWLINNVSVTGENASTLVICIVSEDDIGNYICSVKNLYGTTSQSGTARLQLSM